MDKKQLNTIIKEELINVLTEDSKSSTKGTDIGKDEVARLRKTMRKLKTEQELDDFIEEIAFAFDLIKKH
jgi:hypothetical protein